MASGVRVETVADQCLTLLEASFRSRGEEPPTAILTFVAETVSESDEAIGREDAVTLLQDAGLDLDAEEMDEVASTIEFLTSPDEAGAPEEEALADDGTCALCEREVKRGFHHLVPKETHNRYLRRRRLPNNLEDFPGAECERWWLNHHGLMVCGPCHRAIHLAAPNEVLAEEYNTYDRVMEHPQILAFARYNSKQPARIRHSNIRGGV